MIVTVQQAAERIRRGDLVAIPTETVYGLAADAHNAIAVQKTFFLKGRPTDNPLIVHLSSVNQIEIFSQPLSDDANVLAEHFWPGPLTLVLPKKKRVLDSVTAGLETVALRMPDHPTALELIRLCGPLTAPSANRSGRPSPTRARHVTDDFGDDFPVLDGGECRIGIESTVLDLSSDIPSILRPGKLSAEELEEVISKKVKYSTSDENEPAKSPGNRYTHYKPDARVEWMNKHFEDNFDGQCLYIFHSGKFKKSPPNVIDFKSDFEAMARALFDLYRTADQKNYKIIFIEPLPETTVHPLIHALQNRIQRSVTQ